jgi:hypothetical protein
VRNPTGARWGIVYFRCGGGYRDHRSTGDDTMFSRITLALALAISAFTMIVPASAGPGDFPYAAGYQDGAYNRNGW